jgi:hypothetical protein
MSADTIAAIGFAISCGLLGVIWWEIRSLRKNYHDQATHITVLYGRIGLVEHRVEKLEKRR